MQGARDTMLLAAQRIEKLMDNYQKPELDPAIAEALETYVVQKKASVPDSFV